MKTMKTMKTKKTKKRMSVIVFGICALLLCACGNSQKEDDIPMGRYVEREIVLPGSGYEYMHPLADGGCYLHGNGVDFTKIDAAGEISKKAWLWENNFNVREKTVYGISDSGAVIFAFLPKFYSDEELEAIGTDKEVRYQYYYVDEKGDKHLTKLYGNDYSATETFEKFAYAPDGRLYGATERRVCRIRPESGEVTPLFETSQPAYEFAFIGDVMVVIDRGKAYLYDMADEKLLEDNTVLNEFISSHQSGNIVLAPGYDTDVTEVSETEGAKTEDVKTESAGTETGDEQILYIGCHTGLYRYIWGGSIIEQIADGQMLTLGNTQYSPLALQALANGEFRLLFSGNYMVEMYYDETIPARPSKELTVYSLVENNYVRYAGQLFQKEHPDVLVNYETGMDGDNAVSKEDALRNLNTRLLAGEGPDVLIMDNLDIEQYADKGMLKELDEFLAPYEEEGILYQNIVEGMRMTEADRIYAVPLKVFVPLYLAETKYLNGQTDLADIVAGVEFARKEHPEGPILSAPYPKDLINELLPVCLPAWTTDEKSLDIHKITEFYQTAETLWQLDNAGMDEASRREWQEKAGFEDDDLYAINISFNSNWIPFGGGPETWVAIGYAQSPFKGMHLMHLTYHGFRVGGGYNLYKTLDDVYAFGYGKYGGQAQDVYWGRCIVSLYEQAEEPELAQEFLTLMLTDDMMSKWWLTSGYPIRKDSMERILDIDNHEYAKLHGFSAASINIDYAPEIWPTEEEKQCMYQVLEEASCPFLSGSILEETVKEIGLRVLNKELSPEEGAAEVAGKMAIEMAE